jgi:hypothetical protein
VLGDGVPLSQAAQLAGLDPPETGDAVAALERAGILRADDALDFLHPLIHEAVRATMSTVDRHRAHGDAARLLHAGGAEPERVSAHLLACPPLNEGWEQQILEEAARRAQVRGASESAVAYLRRALEGATSDRLGILLRLGAAEALVDGPAAAEHLGMAHELLTDPDKRAECAAQLARVLLFLGRPDDVAALVGRKVEPGSPVQRRRLEVHLANGAMFEPHLQDAADQALSGALDAGADDLG